MRGKNVSFLVVGSICGSFLVNAVMMACGKVGALPDGGGQADAASADALAGAAALPPGMIVAYGGTQAPEGWLLCDGHTVSRSSYGALYAAVGDSWGKGDGVMTFNLPDLRGRFLRGVDAGAGRDPDSATRAAINAGGSVGDMVGSLQADSLQGHAHAIDSLLLAFASNGPGTFRAANSDQQATPLRLVTDALLTDGAHGAPRASAETRPQNANVNYIIKL